MPALGNSSGKPLQLLLQLILAPFLPFSILTRTDQIRVQLTLKLLWIVGRVDPDRQRDDLEALRKEEREAIRSLNLTREDIRNVFRGVKGGEAP